MKKLIRGLLDFQRHTLPSYRATFARLAKGQSPDCLFISCSDSRVVPNLLVSTDPGDLFTVRNVGNLVPPAKPGGQPSADRGEAAAIEFSLGFLPIEDVVVCGHSSCGAMKAILAGGTVDGAPNLEKWLAHGTPSLQALRERNTQVGEGLPDADRLSQLNVLEQLEHLKTYPIVRDRLAAGTLRLHGWWFDIGAAQVHAYRDDLGRFVPIDETEGDRLLMSLTDEPPALRAVQ
ncbi:carbonic anhydrase [Corallococcus sp. AB011P]|uniref:carbonic anhydrase n=1 Tax=Corallococcus sp. AB011P TaxID=2316735 RepID=UPI000EA0F188|nr:carbonic anhydrase [Corallococcus sp. AB011P]RKG56722.1 carbonic anhydrase [Corallococcus sp. AB011P]